MKNTSTFKKYMNKLKLLIWQVSLLQARSIVSKYTILFPDYVLRFKKNSRVQFKYKKGNIFSNNDKMAFEHQPGMAIECLSIPIKLTKETVVDAQGREVQNCGFKIGGGIDQDFHKSPQGYKDSGIYVTEVYENSPAQRCGLKIHDKILQVNGYDFTMVTHDKAVEYIKKSGVLNMLVARKGVTHS